MSDKVTKPILFVKKNEAKKGSLWNDIANQRIIKQHGGLEIPENDRHAIQRYQSPLIPQTSTSEETKATLTDIEKQIQNLKENDLQPPPTDKPEQEDSKEYFDD